MSRLTKVSIDSVLYDIGSKGINSYATLSEMVNEKVSELYDGCIAWCNEDKKYYQWLSENEIISQFGRWRELEFGSEFQVSDPTVDASTEKYKGKIIQYVGVDDVASGFKRGCFYESRLSNVINYVVATVDASTVGTYYTLDDGGNYNPITLIGDGTGYDASTTYYKKQDVEVYAWAYINSLKVETEFDENSENAVANGIITKKFDEVIQDYTDKNEELKEYVDTDVTTALQQYADDLIVDVEEVTEDKVWSNSKTKDYVDTALEDYTKSATEILQADYDALDVETKLANNYHCTDSGRLYYKGILYGDKKPIELTYEEYKTLDEAGLVEADVDYVVHSNESGVLLPFLLSDLDTNHGDSEISTYEVIETLKSDVGDVIEDVTTLKEDIATELKTSENTDIIYVTLTGDDTFESMGDTYCKYQVKNGICYFQFFVASSVATDTFTEIYNGLPKPIFSQYFSYPVYYNSQGLNKTLQVNISEGGLLTAANALPTTSYMIAGSYPIA